MHTILLLCIQKQRFYSEKELFIHEVEKKHSPNHSFYRIMCIKSEGSVHVTYESLKIKLVNFF